MKKLNLFFITLFFICFQNTNTFAQFIFDSPDLFEKVKLGTTCIVMNNLESDTSKAYQEMFTKYWTLNKVKFITPDQIKENLIQNNSFFEFCYEDLTFEFKPLTSIDKATRVAFSLWLYKENGVNKIAGKLKSIHKTWVASILVDPSLEFEKHPNKFIKTCDYDYCGHLRNWGVGMAKNTIQTFMTCINHSDFESRGKTRFELILYKGSVLKSLRKDTLFIPDYIFMRPNFLGTSESETKDKSELDIYKKKKKILTTEELNNKILNSPKAFYYLSYIKAHGGHGWTTTLVTNSKTGEVVFESTHPGNKFDTLDWKRLFKAIMEDDKK